MRPGLPGPSASGFLIVILKAVVRDAVLSEGSSASKLTHMVASRIQILENYWIEGLSSFLVVDKRLPSILNHVGHSSLLY